MRRARGLTLIELLLALGIVALLMTLALPSFGSMLARHRLKAAAEELSADLAELRLLAAQRGQALHLNLQPGTQWCYALATASGCDCRVPQHCQLKVVRAADHPGVALLAGSELSLDARQPGPLQTPAQAVLQGSEGARVHVGLTPLGRPQLCSPGGAVPGYPRC